MKPVCIHEKISLSTERLLGGPHPELKPFHQRYLAHQINYLVQRAMRAIAHHNFKEPISTLTFEDEHFILKVDAQAPDDFVYADEPLTTQ